MGPEEITRMITARSSTWLTTRRRQKYGYPLSLWAWDEGLRNKINTVLYEPSKTGNQNAPTDLTFEYSDQDVSVRKTFHFDKSYVLSLENSVTQKGTADQRRSHVAGGNRRPA